jgi:nitroreductase
VIFTKIMCIVLGGTNMELEHAVRNRRSIRKFKPDPITREIISEILEAARWAPSWANTQPWEFYVITGDTLEKYRQANFRKCMEGEAHAPEIPMPDPAVWPENFKQKSKRLGRRVLESQNISRDDHRARKDYYGEVFSLFGAPCLIAVCLNRDIPLAYAMLDVGLIMQTISLLSHERGLGTCMLAASVRYPSILRKLLPIPDDRVLVLGTAMGYPDLESPINLLQRERADLDEFVSWVE